MNKVENGQAIHINASKSGKIRKQKLPMRNDHYNERKQIIRHLKNNKRKI